VAKLNKIRHVAENSVLSSIYYAGIFLIIIAGNNATFEPFFLPLAIISAQKIGRQEFVKHLWEQYQNDADPRITVKLLHEKAKNGH
jgi:hypothetical protein